MPKGDKPSLKQKEFAELYVQTGNATEAAMQVYDCKDRTVAGSIAAENMQKPVVTQEITALSERVQKHIESQVLRHDLVHKLLQSLANDIAHDDPNVRCQAQKNTNELIKIIAQAPQQTLKDMRKQIINMPKR